MSEQTTELLSQIRAEHHNILQLEMQVSAQVEKVERLLEQLIDRVQEIGDAPERVGEPDLGEIPNELPELDKPKAKESLKKDFTEEFLKKARNKTGEAVKEKIIKGRTLS